MKPAVRARKILEHAITAPSGAVVVTARRLAQMAPGAQWYAQVDQLRQHMLDKGMVLDESLFTTPLLPKASIGLGSAVKPPAVVGTWDKWIQPIANVLGYLTLAGLAGYVTYYAYQQTIGKESESTDGFSSSKPRRKKRPLRGRMKIAGHRA